MTKVAILWHMHQPYYEDLATGEHVLPWVRLHALKDYFGMAAVAAEFPELRVTFNLVPSLLVQLEAFAEDRARDRHLQLGLKPAEHLTPDEREFVVANFFHAHQARMIDPYPRYHQLREKRRGGAAAFSQDDLRDLQVWHKLAWVDPSYLEGDARCLALIHKGSGFAETDKAVLREVELEILNRVIPEYRSGSARGQFELSTSPFYHPILPLLCDTDVYREGQPHARMPRHRFAHPEDAREQLARAVNCHERIFGERPQGLWPSEGSVSNAVIALAIETGFRWIATDELLLARTLGTGWSRDGGGHVDRPDVMYRPYRVSAEGGDIGCAFRDHALSDLIGFTYAGWGGEAAAEDLCNRLRAAGRRFAEKTGGGEAVIFIILDGENAWEHYLGGGRPFLRALYRRLTEDSDLSTVTVENACRDATERLRGISAGSWIDGSFYIWIGHPDDHRAWDQLAEVRARLDAAHGPRDVASRARDEILIAEGSDWFWWYGDDHSSEHDLVFDDLFRRHVRNAYRALGEPIPDELFVTNVTTMPRVALWSEPVSLLTPTVDGQRTSYFEWLGAGCLESRTAAGAMHRTSEASEPKVRTIHSGFDLERLHLRVDLTGAADHILRDGLGLVIVWTRPAGYRLSARLNGEQTAFVLSGPQGLVPVSGIEAALADIAEVSIPFAVLGVSAGDALAFVVALATNGEEVERHPSSRPLELDVPHADFNRRHWTA